MSAFYTLAVLVLATYRATRLVVKDDLPPILWLRDRLVGGWRPLTGQEWEAVRATKGGQRPFVYSDVNGATSRYLHRWAWVPWWLKELLSCPWCVSAYLAAALTTAADLTVGVPSPWLTAPAVWAGAAILASRSTL